MIKVHMRIRIMIIRRNMVGIVIMRRRGIRTPRIPICLMMRRMRIIFRRILRAPLSPPAPRWLETLESSPKQTNRMGASASAVAVPASVGLLRGGGVEATSPATSRPQQGLGVSPEGMSAVVVGVRMYPKSQINVLYSARTPPGSQAPRRNMATAAEGNLAAEVLHWRCSLCGEPAKSSMAPQAGATADPTGPEGPESASRQSEGCTGPKQLRIAKPRKKPRQWNVPGV